MFVQGDTWRKMTCMHLRALSHLDKCLTGVCLHHSCKNVCLLLLQTMTFKIYENFVFLQKCNLMFSVSSLQLKLESVI